MGRITVSLSDALEADLDAYAKEQHLSVSKVVTQALQGFLPGQEPPPDSSDLAETQAYLSHLVKQLETVRNTVHRMAMAQYGPFAPIPETLTEPLAAPPWMGRFENSSSYAAPGE